MLISCPYVNILAYVGYKFYSGKPRVGGGGSEKQGERGECSGGAEFG